MCFSDIEEKYTKKLERMGTTGTGPVRPFPEKNDYKPDIRITYIDERGREMESKDAFRVLSWKLVPSLIARCTGEEFVDFERGRFGCWMSFLDGCDDPRTCELAGNQAS
uniref:Thiol oxidase n=1 Tax=Ascaris lumbricoides TaxID=6252 RepID=A0A0M3HLI2_ASCLU